MNSPRTDGEHLIPFSNAAHKRLRRHGVESHRKRLAGISVAPVWILLLVGARSLVV